MRKLKRTSKNVPIPFQDFLKLGVILKKEKSSEVRFREYKRVNEIATDWVFFQALKTKEKARKKE